MFKLPKIFAAAIGVALVLLSASTAFATSPHFTSAKATLSGTDLVVSFKEVGLGNNQNISYVASAAATADYACYNNGGNHPQATNKETVSGPVSAAGTFDSGKNGSISASLTISPPGPGAFSCPAGQALRLDSVTYTNVAITDTTNNVSTAIPGTFTAP